MKPTILLKELKFKAIRSSGPGGQHVNKTSSKIELQFSIETSKGLTSVEKERLQLKLKHRLTKEHVLILQCDDSRSQHRNKTLVVKRFLALIENGVKVQKKRKKTTPSKSAVEKRLKQKKQQALKKQHRKSPDF